MKLHKWEDIRRAKLGPRKQSSTRVSSLAASWLRVVRAFAKEHGKQWQEQAMTIRASHLASLCASVLSQDETRGQKPKRRKRARK